MTGTRSSYYDYTTQQQLRAAFWESHPQFTRKPGKTQNDYPADVRQAWVEWVDFLAKDTQISEGLAQRATL